jgi:putative hydrolase of the HAD superfamily
MKNVILFDLGNTLIRYYERSEFPEILRESITNVYNYLNLEGKTNFQDVWQRVKDEDHESKDYQVRPLEGRLTRIFELVDPPEGFMMDLCRCFMNPIFSRSRIYDDTPASLSDLKAQGLRIAIVSNTAWGSPAELWRDEIKRFNLHKYVDFSVFCRDVGWRKPSERIFEFTLKKMNVSPEQCIFVGDDPRWDIIGPRNVGIEAILIDRRGVFQNIEEQRITSLRELCDRLEFVKHI